MKVSIVFMKLSIFSFHCISGSEKSQNRKLEQNMSIDSFMKVSIVFIKLSIVSIGISIVSIKTKNEKNSSEFKTSIVLQNYR